MEHPILPKKYNERLEQSFIEEEEQKLEQIVKDMKLHGRTQQEICKFLSHRAKHYLGFLDAYCSEKRCKEDGEYKA